MADSVALLHRFLLIHAPTAVGTVGILSATATATRALYLSRVCIPVYKHRFIYRFLQLFSYTLALPIFLRPYFTLMV
jgi:hypothetical protein